MQDVAADDGLPGLDDAVEDRDAFVGPLVSEEFVEGFAKGIGGGALEEDLGGSVVDEEDLSCHVTDREPYGGIAGEELTEDADCGRLEIFVFHGFVAVHGSILPY